MIHISVSVTNAVMNRGPNFVSISYDGKPDDPNHDGDYEILSGSDPGVYGDYQHFVISEACLVPYLV